MNKQEWNQKSDREMLAEVRANFIEAFSWQLEGSPFEKLTDDQILPAGGIAALNVLVDDEAQIELAMQMALSLVLAATQEAN